MYSPVLPSILVRIRRIFFPTRFWSYQHVCHIQSSIYSKEITIYSSYENAFTCQSERSVVTTNKPLGQPLASHWATSATRVRSLLSLYIRGNFISEKGFFSNSFSGNLRINDPMLRLFVLVWMTFLMKSTIHDENLNLEIIWKRN